MPAAGPPPPERPCDEYDGIETTFGLPLPAPGQQVDDRWRRVCRTARAGRLQPGPDDDEWVARGLGYMGALLACRGDAGRQELARALPDLDSAYRLHRHSDCMARGLVEARLLAGQSFEETAAACGLTADAVRAYEALHFWVRHRLHARGWIISWAIGPKCWDGLTERDVDVILKRVAFHGGPVLLEQTLKYYTSGWSVPRTLAVLTRAEVGELQERLHTRAFILAWTLPVEKCERALVLGELANELDALAASLPDPAAASGKAAAPSAEQRAWFSAWRKAVRAASGGLSGPTPRSGAKAA